MRQMGVFAVTLPAILALLLALPGTALAQDAGTRVEKPGKPLPCGHHGKARLLDVESAEAALDAHLDVMRGTEMPGEVSGDQHKEGKRQSYWLQQALASGEPNLKRICGSYADWRSGPGRNLTGEALLQGADAILTLYWLEHGHADLSRLGFRTIVACSRTFQVKIGTRSRAHAKRALAHILDTCTDCTDLGFLYEECVLMGQCH